MQRQLEDPALTPDPRKLQEHCTALAAAQDAVARWQELEAKQWGSFPDRSQCHKTCSRSPGNAHEPFTPPPPPHNPVKKFRARPRNCGRMPAEGTGLTVYGR
jgi:hypothetical protein